MHEITSILSLESCLYIYSGLVKGSFCHSIPAHFHKVFQGFVSLQCGLYGCEETKWFILKLQINWLCKAMFSPSVNLDPCHGFLNWCSKGQCQLESLYFKAC